MYNGLLTKAQTHRQIALLISALMDFSKFFTTSDHTLFLGLQLRHLNAATLLEHHSDVLCIRAAGERKNSDGSITRYFMSNGILIPELTLEHMRLYLNAGKPFDYEKIVNNRILVKITFHPLVVLPGATDEQAG